MAAKETIKVELSRADRNLIRELIAAVNGLQPVDAEAEAAVGAKRLLERLVPRADDDAAATYARRLAGAERRLWEQGAVDYSPSPVEKIVYIDAEGNKKAPYVDADGRTRYHY